MWRINEVILLAFREEIANKLDNIMTDFQSECKDEKAVQLLNRIISVHNCELSSISTKDIVEKMVKEPQKEFEKDPEKEGHEKKEGCVQLMKSGKRKGEMCGGKITANELCGRHQPKVPLSDTRCETIMKAGTRKGQACGGKVALGSLYCTKHRLVKCVYKDGLVMCGKPISKCSTSESFCRIHIRDELGIDTSKYVLYLNKHGNREHKYSELIFENRVVVGKQNENGTTSMALTYDDLECVKIYGLPLAENFHAQMNDYLKRKDADKEDGSS